MYSTKYNDDMLNTTNNLISDFVVIFTINSLRGREIKFRKKVCLCWNIFAGVMHKRPKLPTYIIISKRRIKLNRDYFPCFYNILEENKKW